MESRVKSYYPNDIEQEFTTNSTRSSRNAKLYKNFDEKYDDLDNLPIEDNTNEIDIEKLRELVLNNTSKKEEHQIKENLNVLEQRKRQIDEQKIYDINKILEKAKYENSKLKEPQTVSIPKKRIDILSTLQSTELSLDEIKKAEIKYQESIVAIEEKMEPHEELSMTREIKYKNLADEQLNEIETKKNESIISNTNDLSLDLFAELKPTGNTIITDPIKSDINKVFIESDIHSGDTSDIDIIKSTPTNNPSDFFTNSYEFSKKDFADIDEDNFFDEPKKGGIFKIILLILAIFIFIGVIIYFISAYGLGIS